MKLSTIALVLVPTALSIAACGGSSSGGAHAPVSDKQSAATAASRLQATNDAVHGRTGRGLSPAEIPGISGDGVNVEQTYTVQGEQGTAEVIEKADVTSGNVAAEFTVKYHGFSEDGVNVLDGELTTIANVATSEGGANVSTTVRGKIDVTGDLDSTIDIDVTTEVSASNAGAAVTLDGQVVADGVTYHFDHESFQVSNEPL